MLRVFHKVNSSGSTNFVRTYLLATEDRPSTVCHFQCPKNHLVNLVFSKLEMDISNCKIFLSENRQSEQMTVTDDHYNKGLVCAYNSNIKKAAVLDLDKNQISLYLEQAGYFIPDGYRKLQDFLTENRQAEEVSIADDLYKKRLVCAHNGDKKKAAVLDLDKGQISQYLEQAGYKPTGHLRYSDADFNRM